MHGYAEAENLSRNLIFVESQPEGMRRFAAGRHDCFLGGKLHGFPGGLP